MANITYPHSNKTFKSSIDPIPVHAVQFYNSENDLLLPLSRFVRTGLLNGETCIVVATAKHIQSLNECLRKIGVNVAKVQKSGQYLTLDAQEMLAKFMVDGLPNRTLFFNTVTPILEKITLNNKSVRVYGEMVAQLWKDGNKKAVLQLERLWNELCGQYKVALFCAYPELHFIMDQDACLEITDLHTNIVTASLQLKPSSLA